MQNESRKINNDFYNDLGESWFTAKDHPIALLRAENAVRNPWIANTIAQKKGAAQTILDIGCGAGLLSFHLAKEGHKVTGIDLSASSLALARKKTDLLQAEFLEGDATKLPFAKESFDVVCAMDLLEHVESPQKVIEEASRVLKPGGIFFFHTFNRNPISYLIIIKGVEWFVKNAPKDMHIYSLFIKPKELSHFCSLAGLSIESIQGLIPKINSKSFFKMLLTKEVPEDFQFTFSSLLTTGYVGIAIKN